MRNAKMIVILGANGTGKTTLLKHILAMSHQRAIIVTPDCVEWTDKEIDGSERYPINPLNTRQDFVFSGLQRHIFGDRTLQKISAFKKGIVVFDDVRAYMSDKTDEEIHQLMIRRRQREVDFIAVAHSFSDMPRRFFPFCSDLFLFQTKDNVEMRRGVIKNLEEMREIQARVNKIALSHPHYYEHIKYE